MTTRTPKQALDGIAEQIRTGVRFDAGLCKRKTREAYAIPSDGSDDATEAWSRTRYRFRGNWIPGAFIWWTGGSKGHGHVAVMGWRVGHIRTVDFPHPNHWNKTTLAELEKAWPGITYAGTSLDIDGVVPRARMPRIVRRWDHPTKGK